MIGLTVSQQRALSDMGIEIWVRRGARTGAAPAVVAATNDRDAGAVAAAPPSTRSHVASDAVPPPTPRSAAARAAETPVDASTEPADFHAELDCVAVSGVVLVGRWHNPLDKRLAQDIALALAAVHDRATMQAGKVQQAAFRWPATQTGDRSVAGARSAFKAFVRGQTERAHARCVVLFGDVAAQLAEDLETNSLPPVLRQPAIGALRADPNAKKALWLNASQNAPG